MSLTNPPQEALCIVVAEDSILLRAGLVDLLTRFGHRVVAEVGDADALLISPSPDTRWVSARAVRSPAR